MTIAGIVRRVDVNTKNTVQSTAIADAKTEYPACAVGLRATARMFVRILDWIYPF
ncbi:MAG: flagellar basal body L-ring protein FlgH [Nitrospiraceae bacterium]